MARKPRTPFMIVAGKRRRRGSVRRTGMSERKKEYLAYMQSPAWRAYRTAWWAEYDRRNKVRSCYCCGKLQADLGRSLELHHRTYERLGAEEWDDLVGVCRSCHATITRTWRARGKSGMTLTLWELTDEHRKRMRRYQALKNVLRR